jgi:hypothetical protein
VQPLISEVLYKFVWYDIELAELFGDRYYCADYRTAQLSGSDKIIVQDIETSWKRAGRRCLPGYFGWAGVQSAMDEWEESKRRTREEAERTLRQQRRGPTQAEQACIDLLERLLHDLDSSLAAVVLRDVSYLIAGTDAILGAWQRSRAYKSREIYLAAKLFDGPFSVTCANETTDGGFRSSAIGRQKWHRRNMSLQCSAALRATAGCRRRLWRVNGSERNRRPLKLPSGRE